MPTHFQRSTDQAKNGIKSPRSQRDASQVEHGQDFMAQWFSPDVAFPFGRLRHRPMVATQPRVDVAEKDRTLIVTAELPGVKKEDLHVELENGALVIRGDAYADKQVKDEDYVRIERNLARYYRRLPLPFAPDAETIRAVLKDGILEVRVPEPPHTLFEAKPIAVD